MVLAEWALVIKDNRVGHLWYETVIFGTITNYLNYEFILLISTVKGRGVGIVRVAENIFLKQS